ncbi:MAG: ABC transporter permease [Actinobacteria bacterium]|nr:ABC transporter permease [Actinomycetota bacterium]
MATTETHSPNPAGTQVVVASSRFKTLISNQQFILLIVWILMVIGFSLINHIFFSVGVAENILLDWAPLVLIAVGELIVIISGGIDLSVGAIVGFTGVISAFAMRSLYEGSLAEQPYLVLAIGVLVCVIVGLLVGLINSLLINYAKLVPFIATLVTLGACSGMALVFTKGAPVMGGPREAIALSPAWIGPFSRPVLIVVVVVLILWAFVHKARFGRYTFAIGSNSFAARAAGINVKRHVTKVYMLSGLMAGLAGFFFYLRLGSGAPTSGLGNELDAIAAVVIGGAALTGGVGRVSGTVLGALILTTVTSGLIISGVDPQWKRVVVAALIAIAATLQALRKTEGGAS